jgi:hypothetical protein
MATSTLGATKAGEPKLALAGLQARRDPEGSAA